MIWGGGVGFCGVSSTPEMFIFIAFLGHFLASVGFHRQTFFSKTFEQNFENFRTFPKFFKNTSFDQKLIQKHVFWPSFATKGRFGGLNSGFFTISSPSAPKLEFLAVFGGRSVDSATTPSWGLNLPKNISGVYVYVSLKLQTGNDGAPQCYTLIIYVKKWLNSWKYIYRKFWFEIEFLGLNWF